LYKGESFIATAEQIASNVQLATGALLPSILRARSSCDVDNLLITQALWVKIALNYAGYAFASERRVFCLYGQSANALAKRGYVNCTAY